MSLDQLEVVGHCLLRWDLGLFLCLMDNNCQRPTSFHVTYLGPSLFSSLLWKGEAGSCDGSHLGWGGNFDLLPPSSVFQDCPTAGLPQRPAPLQLFSPSPDLPGHWGRGGQMSVLQMKTRGTGRAQDLVRLWGQVWGSGEQFPQGQRNSTVVRNTPSLGEFDAAVHLLWTSVSPSQYQFTRATIQNTTNWMA